MKQWRLRHLLFSWVAYWIAIIAIKLGPAIAAALRATTGSDSNGTSNVSGGWSDATGLTVTIVNRGVQTWSGTASLTTVIGWAVIPPLLLWGLWLLLGSRQRQHERTRDQLGEGVPGHIPMQDRTYSTREPR